MNKSTLHKHIQNYKKVKDKNPEEFLLEWDVRKEIEIIEESNK